MADESSTDAKWTLWQKKSKHRPQSRREAFALWVSQLDWAMLLVPGIVVIGTVMIVVPLMILGVL